MNFKTTFVLVLLLIAGGLFFWFAKDDPAPDPIALREAAARGEALWPAAVDREQIRRIVIERDGRKTELRREEQDWWQTQPVRFKLNRWSVTSLLDALADLAAVETLHPGKRQAPSLQEAGLSEPAARVQVFSADADDPILNVRVGRKLSAHTLIQLEGQPSIRVVGNALRDAVTADLNGWRSRSLDAPTAAEASAAAIRSGSQEITLQKIDGNWYLDAEGTRRASGTEAEKLVQVARHLSIAGFAADAPAQLSTYGLDEPIATLQITRRAIQEEIDAQEDATFASAGILQVGNPTQLEGDQYFAAWITDPEAPVAVLTVSRSSVAALLDLDPQTLLEKKLFALPENEVARLVIEQPKQPALVLERDAGNALKFGVPAPGYALDASAGANLVRSLAETEATAFVSEEKLITLQRGEPVATVHLTRRGEDQARTARFYETREKDAPALVAVVEGESLGYVLNGELLAAARTPQAALRDRLLLNFRKLAPVAFQIRNASGVADFVARPAERDDQEPGWQLAGGQLAESNALEELLVELENLRVYRWLTGPAEVGDEAVELHLTPGGDKAEPLVLRVNPQTRAATLTGEAQGFELSEAALTVLQQRFVADTPQPEAPPARTQESAPAPDHSQTNLEAGVEAAKTAETAKAAEAAPSATHEN